MMLKISKYICVPLISLFAILPATASLPAEQMDSLKNGETKLYTSREEARKALEKGSRAVFLSGISVGVDIVGPIMRVVSSRGHIEGMCRVNLLDTYFPIFEMGLSECNHTDESTNVNFTTKAPYFRLGCDVNFSKNKQSGNRILGGVRYGYTSFDYDVSSSPIIDPTWGTTVPYNLQGLNGKKHWAELLFGIESKICSFIQIGWSVRYKFSIKDDCSDFGKPWYVPGYGRNKNGIFGANFNLIFEL